MVSGSEETTSEYATDAILLQRFVTSRDQTAFTAIVHRHGGLVWGVCRRRLERREDAEDAFQTAFLIFAVKAHAIRSGQALPAWLHRAACRAASRVASASSFEALHEAPTNSVDAFAEITRREAAIAIDEELVRLPERYRNAVVLFHLEGLERREVAERLGTSEQTVKALLSRGRALLRTRLARRGLALPMLLPLGLDPLPAEAIESTCRLAFSLTRAGLHPWDFVTLQSETLRPMTALLGNKFVAPTLVGMACLTLFFATRGDANANGEPRSGKPALHTTADTSEIAAQTSMRLSDATTAGTANENTPANGEGARGETAAMPVPQEPIMRAPSEVRIMQALNEETDLQFPNTPLRQALQFLADYHEIKIIIDEQALEEEGLTVDDNVDIVLSGITLRSALDILLKRYDLAYVIDDEVMEITTQSKAARIISTEAYDVSALVENERSVAEVAKAIETLLQPTTSAGASMSSDSKSEEAEDMKAATVATPLADVRVVPFGNRLLIQASQANQRQVEKILSLMGQAQPKVEPITTKVVPIKVADIRIVADTLENTASRLKAPQARFAVDSRTNSIILIGTRGQIRVMENNIEFRERKALETEALRSKSTEKKPD